MHNSTQQDGNVYHCLSGIDAQQEPGWASLIMSTYNNLVHESLVLPSPRAGAAIMQDIQHEADMEIQEVFQSIQSRTSSGSQIYGSNKAESPLQQGFRTGMQIRKAPEARIMRRPSSTLPLNLALNNVAAAAAITSNCAFTGGDNPEIIEIRTVVIYSRILRFASPKVTKFLHFYSTESAKLAFE